MRSDIALIANACKLLFVDTFVIYLEETKRRKERKGLRKYFLTVFFEESVLPYDCT